MSNYKSVIREMARLVNNCPAPKVAEKCPYRGGDDREKCEKCWIEYAGIEEKK